MKPTSANKKSDRKRMERTRERERERGENREKVLSNVVKAFSCHSTVINCSESRKHRLVKLIFELDISRLRAKGCYLSILLDWQLER